MAYNLTRTLLNNSRVIQANFVRTLTSSQSSSSTSGGTNNLSATENLKDKAGEYANKARDAAGDVANSAKNAANKAAEWIKDTKENLTSNPNIDKTRDNVKNAADQAAKKSY